jgi:hypothetical protein
MDLVSLTLGLPLAPVRGLLAVARLLQEQAEHELYNPVQVRRELEDIEADRSGAADDEEAEQREQQVLDRLLRSRPESQP